MEWLIADGDTQRRFPARVKLRSSATVRNVDRAPRPFVSICEFYSQSLAHLWDFSIGLLFAYLCSGDAGLPGARQEGFPGGINHEQRTRFHG